MQEDQLCRGVSGLTGIADGFYSVCLCACARMGVCEAALNVFTDYPLKADCTSVQKQQTALRNLLSLKNPPASVSVRENFASLCKIILCVQLDLLSCCVKSD